MFYLLTYLITYLLMAYLLIVYEYYPFNSF